MNIHSGVQEVQQRPVRAPDLQVGVEEAEAEASPEWISAFGYNYPIVDLNCRNKEGWSLVFRAIQMNELGEK